MYQYSPWLVDQGPPTFELPRLPHPATDLARCATGPDGSSLWDTSNVYLIMGPLQFRLNRVDYFHGHIDGEPVAQMLGDVDCFASEMVSREPLSPMVCRIYHLQRRFRRRRARRAAAYTIRMHKVGLMLARLTKKVLRIAS